MNALKWVAGFVAGVVTIAAALAAAWALLSLVGVMAEWLGATHKSWNPKVELFGERYWALGLGALLAMVVSAVLVTAVILWVVIPVSQFGSAVISTLRRDRSVR